MTRLLSRVRLHIALSLVLVGPAPFVRAEIVTYTSRPAWDAAAGTPGFFEDFEGFSVDLQFRTVPREVGPFILEQLGSGVLRNFIDVPPVAFPDNNGTAHASLYTDFGTTRVAMTFPKSALLAWGADFYGADDAEGLELNLLRPDGSSLTSLPVPVSTGFFGFVTTEPVGQIVFASRTNIPGALGEGFGLDNITGVFGVPVPEPSSFILGALGLLTVVICIRRRGFHPKGDYR